MSTGEPTPGPWLDWDTLEWRCEPRKLLESAANARLMAAAPDLLAACEAVLGAYRVHNWRKAGVSNALYDAIEQVRAATAKARGVA